VPQWIADLNNPNHDVREAAIRALGQVKDPRAVMPLLDIFLGPDADLRYDASDSLAIIHDPSEVEPLIAALKDPRPEAGNTQPLL
jgi:HEAT repeat protein